MFKRITAFGLGFLSTVVFANKNNCANLEVNLQNQTGINCILRSAEIFGGSLGGSVLPSILKNGGIIQSFRLQQTNFLGPHVKLNYQCGYRVISLMMQQSYCLLSAGEVKGSAHTLSNIHAKYAVKPGSYWYSQPGVIDWVLF